MARRSLKGIDSVDIVIDYQDHHYEVPVIESLCLRDMSIQEIKDTLNEIPARLAFWKAMQITLERERDEAQDEFDLWYSHEYMDIDTENARKTEGWKKSKVMLDNPEEYRKHKKILRDLQDTLKKLDVITSSYNNQIWTLREIARLTDSEIQNLSASTIKRKGSLSNL